MMNKKVLAAAVVGALFAGNAMAADLSATGGAVPAYFAKEIIATTAAPVTLTTSASAATQLGWKINYNFSSNEVRYARVECSSNLKFSTAAVGAPGATVVTSTGTALIGAINGLGSNVLTFSVTSPAAAPFILAADTFTVSGDHAITGTDQNVNCSVALYDQPSQAQAGGAPGLITNTSFSGAYLSFAPSYELVATASTHTADVEAVPSYSRFVAANVTSPTSSRLGNATLSFRVKDPDGAGAQTAPFKINGTPIALTDLFAAGTNLLVGGDFSIAANAAAPLYTGAALALVTAGAPATALTATQATFSNVQAGFASLPVDLACRTVAGGNCFTPIPVADYTAAIKAVAFAPTVYAVSDIAPIALSKIVRNGTELQAPLAQIPGGWYSRLVLTNTSSLPRAYTISLMSEENVTLTAGTLTGTIPANGTKIIDDLKTVYTGNNRATLNVQVAGPNNAIQGLYQIVNPVSGSISNETLVRPGTN
jgi:hypothetical protein